MDQDSPLARAAGAVLANAGEELAGLRVGLVLGDRNACVVSIPFADQVIKTAFDIFGVEPGLCLSEEIVGTNAVGTPVVTREGQRVEGEDHFAEAFREFSCYGQPIFHPLTRRLEGVLNISGLMSDNQQLMVPFVRRMVGEIEERLQAVSSNSQRLLLDAFQVAARSPRRPVVVVGHGMVLATPAALDLLDPADHAVLRSYADDRRRPEEASSELQLISGRVVRLSCRSIPGADGMLMELTPTRHDRPAAEPETAGWPLIVIGEMGSGRTCQALEAAGADAIVLDATAAVRDGDQAWAAMIGYHLVGEGPAVVIENVQLLSEGLTTILAGLLARGERRVVLTSTPGEHLDSVHAPLVAACLARQDLVPLRRRRHEVPQLAQRMLDEIAGPAYRRLTADTLRILAAQPWPGNLAELRRVVTTLAGKRSTGDIVPADLPETHRGSGDPSSPLRQAEREVILAALEVAGGNKLQAARQLGMSRSTLYNRMRALGIY